LFFFSTLTFGELNLRPLKKTPRKTLVSTLVNRTASKNGHRPSRPRSSRHPGTSILSNVSLILTIDVFNVSYPVTGTSILSIVVLAFTVFVFNVSYHISESSILSNVQLIFTIHVFNVSYPVNASSILSNVTVRYCRFFFLCVLNCLPQ
jgi:hypothetical protein